jgi:dTDP-4-amino-4,6-dideoxygalactose transaminase
MEGLVDKYTWQGHGSSFGLSDLLAAFLDAQLEAADQVRSRRRHVSTTYRRLLEPFAQELAIELPYESPDAEPADHMFYILLPEAAVRHRVIEKMRSDDVNPTFHYVPLHRAPGAESLADRFQECPVTDDISARLLRLPFYNDLTDDDLERVVSSLVDSVRSSRGVR